MRILIVAMLALLTLPAVASASLAPEAPVATLTMEGCEPGLVRFDLGDETTPCMTQAEANAPDVIKFYPCFRSGTWYAVILGRVSTGCIG